MHKNAEMVFVKHGLNFFSPNKKVFEIGPDDDFVFKRLIEEKVGRIDYYFGDLSNYEAMSCLKMNLSLRNLAEHAKKPITSVKKVASLFVRKKERGSKVEEGLRNLVRFKGEYSIDIPDNTFDAVYSSQVIEHVRRPWVWIKELARVVRPGGFVMVVNPISMPYHDAPIDCWRIYPEGMKALFEEAGLDCEMALFDSLDGGVIDNIAVGRKK